MKEKRRLSTSIMKRSIKDYSYTDLILYEDEGFLVVNKPPGIKSQDDPSDKTQSLWNWAEQAINTRLHLHSRLDRPVSGAVVFTKLSREGKCKLDSSMIRKEYIAVVPKTLQNKGTLIHYVKRNSKRYRAEVSDQERVGFKEATLHFEICVQLLRYTALKIRIETGRFHQIRSQLGYIGLPIKGDVKYGARRSNKDRSIDLHSVSLKIPGIQGTIYAPPWQSEGIWKVISEQYRSDLEKSV